MAKIEDHSKELLLHVAKKASERLDEAGDIVVNEARDLVHIKTGATHDSIHKQVDGMNLSVGATTPYAKDLEARFPFLRPAIHKSLAAIKRVFAK
jgi:hypothetical protein